MKKPTKTASELRDMIAVARRQIEALPIGAYAQQGRNIRLDAAEARLFPKGKSKP
jgi:hypothetical protein